MREYMHELVAELRRAGFSVTSATREMESANPLMRIVTPDEMHTILVKEVEFFADPRGCTDQIRFHLRQLGYAT